MIGGRAPRQTLSPTDPHANTMRSASKDGGSRPEQDQTRGDERTGVFDGLAALDLAAANYFDLKKSQRGGR